MWILSFWIFPVISACVWVATLIAMLAVWAAEGKPRYASEESDQTTPYISDIGASGLKPLFIAGSVVMVVFLDLAFLSERWLRHRGKLVMNKGRFDKFCSIASLFFAVAGAAGLILLSIFDTLRHPRLHSGFLILFIGGYLISAIFICMEYLRLGVAYRRQHMVLFASFWIKLIFIIIELGLAIAFGVLLTHGKHHNVAAALEWAIAFVFTFYVLSFVVDLLPAVRTRHHVPQGEKVIHMSSVRPSTSSGALPPVGGRQQDVTYEQPLTTDSMGDSGNTYRGQMVNGHPTSGRRTLEV